MFPARKQSHFVKQRIDPNQPMKMKFLSAGVAVRLSLLARVFCPALLIVLLAMPAIAAPKRVLVVTTTTGFRHSSIPTAEKVLAEMAQDSSAFTVEYARVENNDPQFKGAD